MEMTMGDGIALMATPKKKTRKVQAPPESGLERVRLPHQGDGVVTLLSDGQLALSTLVRSADGCSVQVRLADPGPPRGPRRRPARRA